MAKTSPSTRKKVRDQDYRPNLPHKRKNLNEYLSQKNHPKNILTMFFQAFQALQLTDEFRKVIQIDKESLTRKNSVSETIFQKIFCSSLWQQKVNKWQFFQFLMCKVLFHPRISNKRYHLVSLQLMFDNLSENNALSKQQQILKKQRILNKWPKDLLSKNDKSPYFMIEEIIKTFREGTQSNIVSDMQLKELPYVKKLIYKKSNYKKQALTNKRSYYCQKELVSLLNKKSVSAQHLWKLYQDFRHNLKQKQQMLNQSLQTCYKWSWGFSSYLQYFIDPIFSKLFDNLNENRNNTFTQEQIKKRREDFLIKSKLDYFKALKCLSPTIIIHRPQYSSIDKTNLFQNIIVFQNIQRQQQQGKEGKCFDRQDEDLNQEMQEDRCLSVQKCSLDLSISNQNSSKQEN